MEYKEIFAKKLTELREEAGMKQAELAKKMGVARQTISNYENAERGVNIDFLAQIADFFNVSVDYLMGRTEVKRAIGDIPNACITTGLTETAIDKLSNFQKSEKWILSQLIQSYAFHLAIENLQKYSELNTLIEKRLKGKNSADFIIELRKSVEQLGQVRTEEEQSKLDAQILLEDYGYIVLTSDYDILDFYKQRFTTLLSEAIDDITRKK